MVRVGADSRTQECRICRTAEIESEMLPATRIRRFGAKARGWVCRECLGYDNALFSIDKDLRVR